MAKNGKGKDLWNGSKLNGRAEAVRSTLVQARINIAPYEPKTRYELPYKHQA